MDLTIYKDSNYLRLADQIESQMLKIKALTDELEQRWPTEKGRCWMIMGDNRPYIKSYDTE